MRAAGAAFLLGSMLASPCGAAPVGEIDVPADVANAIVACWQPPHADDEITLSVSFRRDGSVFGQPRVTFAKSAVGPGGRDELVQSALRAIVGCTPLRFTPSLGAAIAGRIFLIRFVARRPARSVAL